MQAVIDNHEHGAGGGRNRAPIAYGAAVDQNFVLNGGDAKTPLRRLSIVSRSSIRTKTRKDEVRTIAIHEGLRLQRDLEWQAIFPQAGGGICC